MSGSRPLPQLPPSISVLQQVYRNGVLSILERLEFLVSRGRSDAAARAALRDAKATLVQLDQFADRWIEENIPAEYRKGWDGAVGATLIADLEGVRGQIRYADFAHLHRQAIEVIAYNMQDAVKAATTTMGRKMDGIFRRAGLEATMQRLFTGETIKETAGIMKERLVLSGLDSFTDKAGRVWRLDTYCTMVARTTTREATTLGVLGRAGAGGYDLLRVSEHAPTCEICVLPDTEVSGPVARAVIRREYTGEIVSIGTASGNKLSGTPDHSVLTERGWRCLKDIKPGDKVLTDSGCVERSDRVTGIAPDKIQMPALIEDVFRAFAPPFGMHILMSPSGGELNSDIFNGKIDIVFPYSSLELIGDFYKSQIIGNALFENRIGDRSAFSGFSSTDQGFKPVLAATPCFMSGFDLLSLLFGAKGCPSLFSGGRYHRLPFFGVHGVEGSMEVDGGRSYFDASPVKVTRNGPGVNVKHFPNLCSGFSRFIEADNFLGLLFAQCPEKFTPGADADSVFNQDTFSPLVADIEGGSYLMDRLSGAVTIDEVLDVSVSHYSGHVYDLQTVPNWYFTNNIISHNCAPLGGKVFSISGDDRRYPTWNAQIPVHPSCLHTVGVYVREYDSRADWRQAHSNTPLDVDGRSEAEKAAYDAIQAGNREQNEMRRQYERYVARLGTENVGTIQNFARSKRLNTERYQELQGLYRDAGKIIG